MLSTDRLKTCTCCLLSGMSSTEKVHHGQLEDICLLSYSMVKSTGLWCEQELRVTLLCSKTVQPGSSCVLSTKDRMLT